mmetsp:Transcript_70398/g.156753  ORF Transcript_70398/g.156753 Transcript_70398/m.156753 type:complete len:210 (+) Transcript_70398:1252-1881(+)
MHERLQVVSGPQPPLRLYVHQQLLLLPTPLQTQQELGPSRTQHLRRREPYDLQLHAEPTREHRIECAHGKEIGCPSGSPNKKGKQRLVGGHPFAPVARLEADDLKEQQIEREQRILFAVRRLLRRLHHTQRRHAHRRFDGPALAAPLAALPPVQDIVWVFQGRLLPQLRLDLPREPDVCRLLGQRREALPHVTEVVSPVAGRMDTKKHL